MPIYEVEDENGNILELEGDSPPTEAELEQIFAQTANVPRETTAEVRSESVLPAPAAEAISGANRGFAAIPDFFIEAGNAAVDLANDNPAIATAGARLLEPFTGRRDDIAKIPKVQETLEAVTGGEFGKGNFMEPGLGRTLVQEGAKFAPGVATAFVGSAPTVAKVTQGLVDDASRQAATTAGRLRAGDSRAVGSTINAAGEVASDPAAKQAIAQGFDKNVVATIKASTPQTKRSMKRMVSLAESAINKTVKTRPADEVGRVVGRRISTIAKTNKAAGKELDVVAKGLQNKAVDISPALRGLVDDLSDMGIKISDDLKSVNLKGSAVEDLPGAQKSILLMLRRGRTAGGNAFQAHRLKRFIDTRVSFDKSQPGGLAGDLERIFKSYRHNIDQALDARYPKYKAVNDTFSQTRTALDEFSKAAGGKLDVNSPNAAKQIGTLSRRLLSNVQSRAQLMDALDIVEETAKKFGADVSEDLFSLAKFADDLDNVFKPAAQTSFRSEVAKGGADVAREGVTRAAFNKATEAAASKISGVSDEAALAAIKDVLKN